MGDKEHFVTPATKYAESGVEMTGKESRTGDIYIDRDLKVYSCCHSAADPIWGNTVIDKEIAPERLHPRERTMTY